MIIQHHFERGGERLAIVLQRGPKWSRVLDCGTLHAHKIPTIEVDKYSRPVDLKASRLASRLDQRRKNYKRLGVFSKRFTDKATREAVTLLRAQG